jgi:hypothetical protein
MSLFPRCGVVFFLLRNNNELLQNPATWVASTNDEVDTVTPQKYLPKPGFQGKTGPLQKIIPTLLLKQLILKFSVSIDFYKRNLF